MNEEIVHVGIDVSKHHLDLDPFDAGTSRIENSTRAIASLIRRYQRSPKRIVVCCEATGGYENLLCRSLLDAGICVARLNAARVREFARSQGILAKTDRIDARVLSEYGRINRPRVLQPGSEWMDRARALMIRREELMMIRKQEKARLDPVPLKEIAQLLRQHLRSIERQLVLVETRLDDLLAEHAELNYRFERLTAV